MKMTTLSIKSKGMFASLIRSGALALAALGAFTAAPAYAQHGNKPVHIDMGGESEYSKNIVLPFKQGGDC